MITLKEFFKKPYEVYILCKVDIEAEILFKEFDKMGKKWHDGEPYRNDWNYKQQFGRFTCYSNRGYYEHIKNINWKPGQLPKLVYDFEEIEFEKRDIVLGEKITLKTFFDSNAHLSIHCNTRKKAIKLCREFKRIGKSWYDGRSYYLHNKWWKYKENTVYSNNYLYGELNRVKALNPTARIYEFEDIIFEEGKKKVTNKEKLLDKAKTEKLTKDELRDLLIYLCKDKEGNINLTDLDFSKFNGNINISYMKVKGDLLQSCQEVEGNLLQGYQKVNKSLFQIGQKVQGNLEQNHQDVQGNLSQEYQKVQGKLWQNCQTVKNDLWQDNQKVEGKLIQDKQIIKGENHE